MIREGKSGLGFKDGFVGLLIEAQSKLNGVEIIKKQPKPLRPLMAQVIKKT